MEVSLSVLQVAYIGLLTWLLMVGTVELLFITGCRPTGPPTPIADDSPYRNWRYTHEIIYLTRGCERHMITLSTTHIRYPRVYV